MIALINVRYWSADFEAVKRSSRGPQSPLLKTPSHQFTRSDTSITPSLKHYDQPFILKLQSTLWLVVKLVFVKCLTAYDWCGFKYSYWLIKWPPPQRISRPWLQISGETLSRGQRLIEEHYSRQNAGRLHVHKNRSTTLIFSTKSFARPWRFNHPSISTCSDVNCAQRYYHWAIPPP